MTDTGKLLKLDVAGLILLYAGDRPGQTIYGEHDIPNDAGAYRILEGRYSVAQKEAVTIYRLQPNRAR
jgi:hypothetical protein